MKIAVSGSSGLVGHALCGLLAEEQHDVCKLVRRTTDNDHEIEWNIESGQLATDKLNACDAVVHLAGENISEGRWSTAKKKRIRESRVNGTAMVCSTLAEMERPPRTLIAASAIGYYGSRGEMVCTETSPPGDDFLADVCVAWEQATQPARDVGIRVVNLRIGVVLSCEGGALKKMLPPFRFGLGGRIGNGQQFWSWITLHDLIHVISRCLSDDSLSGPVNAVSPNPATNLDFTKELGKALGRPTIFPMPAPIARLVFGEMGEALILASTRVAPERLQQVGHQFEHATLEDTFKQLSETQ